MSRTTAPGHNVHAMNWIPTVYFAMGLPFVVLNMVAVLMYKGLGVDNVAITFWTSLIMLPWTLKPLWSPLMELWGSKKLYVVATELTAGAGFLVAGACLSGSAFFAASIGCLAVVAFAGATHDVAADGIYMSLLSSKLQARYIGWQGAFYNIAKIVGTGALVWMAGWLNEAWGSPVSSWTVVMFTVAAIMATLGLYNAFALPSVKKSPTDSATAKEDKTFSAVVRETVQVIKSFFTKRHIVYYISFIILYRFAEGFVMKIVPLFLKSPLAQGGLGLSDKQIGLFYGTYGAAAFVIGSMLGGYYISHMGLRKSLMSLALVFNLPFAVYTLLAWFQPSQSAWICSGIVFEYFGYGFGFVGLTLFMMQQVAPGKHQMAHYAFASGIMNLGVMLPGMASGWVWKMLGGYLPFFLFTLGAIAVPLLITRFVPFTYGPDGKPLQRKEALEAALTD